MKSNNDLIKKIFYFMAVFYFFCAVSLVQRSDDASGPVQKALWSRAEAADDNSKDLTGRLIAGDLGQVHTDLLSEPDPNAPMEEQLPFYIKEDTKSYFERQSDGALSLRVHQGIHPRFTGTIENIQITSSGGSVHLEGSVKNEEERTMIADQISHMAGVDSVDNQLVIQ